MTTLGRRAVAFLLRQNGQALGEYSLLISFIAVLLIITTVIAFRDSVHVMWQSFADQLAP